VQRTREASSATPSTSRPLSLTRTLSSTDAPLSPHTAPDARMEAEQQASDPQCTRCHPGFHLRFHTRCTVIRSRTNGKNRRRERTSIWPQERDTARHDTTRCGGTEASFPRRRDPERPLLAPQTERSQPPERSSTAAPRAPLPADGQSHRAQAASLEAGRRIHGGRATRRAEGTSGGGGPSRHRERRRWLAGAWSPLRPFSARSSARPVRSGIRRTGGHGSLCSVCSGGRPSRRRQSRRRETLLAMSIPPCPAAETNRTPEKGRTLGAHPCVRTQFAAAAAAAAAAARFSPSPEQPVSRPATQTKFPPARRQETSQSGHSAVHVPVAHA